MTQFAELCDLVAKDLETGGHTTEASEIRTLSDTAGDNSRPAAERVDALEQVRMRCHVKWLGDIYLAHLSQTEWWSRLEKLSKAARKLKQTV